MFQFPIQAEFNRPLPKSKIYTFAKPTRAVRDRIVSGIQDIVWKYKLAPETVNLPARHGIQEVQVFEVTLKTEELAEDVLHTIDEAIPHPIIYKVTFEDRVRFSGAYKRSSLSDSSKNVIEAYFTSDWVPRNKPLLALPVVLDMAALYEVILQSLIPLARRPGEPFEVLVQRALKIRAQEKERMNLEICLRRERQFNRKIHLNSQLRNCLAQIEKLRSPYDK
jgi:hypothetical protein